jgi:cytochrome bd-type quinol oxidase subunit 2
MNLMHILSQIDIEVGEGENQINLPGPNTANDGSTINTLMQFAFIIGGVAAMFVIILAGIQFITSQGDPEKAKKARSTIIYAVIGLVICVSSFTIVRFVLGRLG